MGCQADYTEEELKLIASVKQEERARCLEIIDEWVIDNKTSLKWLDAHGLRNAEDEGDCIFLNYSDEFDAIEELKQKVQHD